jgi:hypothetical protein
MGLYIKLLVLIRQPQNGVAERNNRHLLEVARSMMFQMNVPKYLWSEAVLTATYLINHMSSKILGMKSPIELLLDDKSLRYPLRYLVVSALLGTINL